MISEGVVNIVRFMSSTPVFGISITYLQLLHKMLYLMYEIEACVQNQDF